MCYTILWRMSMDHNTVLQWRATAEEEVAAIRARLGPLEAELRRKLAEIEAYDRLLALGDGEMPSGVAMPEPGRARGSLADVAYRVLKEHGKPLYYKELAALIEQSGFAIPGQDGPANLVAHICRDERFCRVGSGTYGLAEWPGAKALPRRRRLRRTRAQTS
jgi:hypothetical protein